MSPNLLSYLVLLAPLVVSADAPHLHFEVCKGCFFVLIEGFFPSCSLACTHDNFADGLHVIFALFMLIVGDYDGYDEDWANIAKVVQDQVGNACNGGTADCPDHDYISYFVVGSVALG